LGEDDILNPVWIDSGPLQRRIHDDTSQSFHRDRSQATAEASNRRTNRTYDGSAPHRYFLLAAD
jgi:hypothetical protein